MNRMPYLPGKSIERGDKLNFVWNADLVSFDGPLISLFKKEDDDFIFFWVDCDDRYNRWIAAPISRANLKCYLRAEIPLSAVIDDNETLLAFELTPAGQRRNAKFLSPAQLLASYRPADDSYLFPEIATEAAIRLADTEAKKYKIKLDGELYIDDIALVPRVYQQLYSFHYGFANIDRAAVKEALSKQLRKWKGGINAVNIFTGLRSVTPSIHRARVVHLQYASPGHIELELLKDLANRIDASCDRILGGEEYRNAEALYSEVYSYFRAEKISGFDSETNAVSTRLTKRQSERLYDFVDLYFNMMDWTAYRVGFDSLGLDPLSQLRMLLAYYRRLKTLRKFIVAGKIELT